MAGIQLSDDEQSERLKAWWKENGVSVVTGAVLGIAVIVGVNYWRSYKAEQAEAASALYARMLQPGDEAEISDAGNRLLEDYSGTAYAGKAALVLAKTAFEDGRADDAARHLEWAMDNAPDESDRRLAILRLARVALSQDSYDRVDALLSKMEIGGYASEYHELRGDLAMARDDPETARSEYQAALDNLPEQSGFVDMLTMKLDAAVGATK